MRLPLLLALAALLSCARDPHRAPPPAPPDGSLPDALSVDEASTPDSAAPYDLSADLALRGTTARSFFSRSSYPAYATRLEGSVYLLISPQGPAMLSAGDDELRRALRFYYGGHSTPSDPTSPPPFTRRPEHAISVYLFATRAAFVDFSIRRESVDPDHPVKLYGLFAPKSHDLVISGQDVAPAVHRAVGVDLRLLEQGRDALVHPARDTGEVDVGDPRAHSSRSPRCWSGLRQARAPARERACEARWKG